MQPNTTRKQTVDVRAGVIEATTGDTGQTNCQSADRGLIADLTVSTCESVPTIHPHARSRVDQNIGDPRVGEQRLQRSRAQDSRGQLSASTKDTRLPKDDGLVIKNLRNQDLRGSPALPYLRPHRG